MDLAPSTIEFQGRRERLALADSAGIGLGVRDVAIAVRIECEAGLEGGDLRLVDDHVEEDAVGLDPDPRVVVDREVSERVRHGQRRYHEGHRHADPHGETDAARSVGGDAHDRRTGSSRAGHASHARAPWSSRPESPASVRDRAARGRPHRSRAGLSLRPGRLDGSSGRCGAPACLGRCGVVMRGVIQSGSATSGIVVDGCTGSRSDPDHSDRSGGSGRRLQRRHAPQQRGRQGRRDTF